MVLQCDPEMKRVFLLPLFTGLVLVAISMTSCQNTKQNASANVPPAAAPAASPAALFPEVSNDSPPPDYGAYPGSTSSSSTSASKPKPKLPPPPPKPFVLREGEKLVSHKVQKGEYLNKLAKKYGTTVSRIKSANRLTSDKILAGKVYKIPTMQSQVTKVTSSVSSPGRTTAPARPPAPAVTNTYKPATSGFPSTTSTNRTYTPSSSSYSPAPPSPPKTGTYQPIGKTTDLPYGAGPTVTPPPPTSSSITIPSSGGSGSAFPSPDF